MLTKAARSIHHLYLVLFAIPLSYVLDVLLTVYEEAIGAAIRESFTFSARVCLRSDYI